MDEATLTIWILLLFPLLFGGFWCAILMLMSRLSGWNRLARKYARDDVPDGGKSFRWQSGRVGFIGYNHCLHIRVRPTGLALSLAFPLRFGHPALFIPWSAVHDRQDANLFWIKATRFDVGRPPLARLTLPRGVFEGVSQTG